jgi:hypothetical protein
LPHGSSQAGIDHVERGPLGVQLTSHLFDRKRIARGGTDRSIRVTTSGRRAFSQTLGLQVPR